MTLVGGGAVTFWTLIADAAQRESTRPLLADEHGRSLTARRLRDAACATAAALAERGVRAGTVVSWQLPTTLETMVVMAALARLGAVQNPIIPSAVGTIDGSSRLRCVSSESPPSTLADIADRLPIATTIDS